MPSAASPAFRLRAVCALLFLGTLLLFSRAVNHDFLDCDDPDYVTLNFHVQGGFTPANLRWAFTSGDAANWHPLTWLSHMLDWRLFGSDPHGHHATSVVWHALSAVLAFLALRRLTRAFWTSLVCAALFAWHPLRVESVAWVAERKDVLSTFFGLAALWAYAGYAEKRRESRGGAGWHYALALAAFAVGLMCKPMLVTLPFLLLLLDGWPLGRFASAPDRPAGVFPRALTLTLEKAPFFLLAAGSCAVTYLVQKKGGAVAEWIPLSQRLANAVVALARYLGHFFWPFGLAVGYPYPTAPWPAGEVAAAAALALAITALGAAQWRRRPWLLVGWLWFVGMLMPVIGIVQVGLQAMADRYTYLPMLGVQVAALWTLRDLFPRRAPRWLAPAAAAAGLAFCAIRTWNQLGVWKDSLTLYRHALAVTRDNYLAEGYLGSTLLSAGQAAEAEAHFRRALAIKGDFALARVRLGLALEEEGRPAEAEACYRAVLRAKPHFSDAHVALGRLLLKAQQPAEALAHFQAALETRPKNALAHSGLAEALADLNRPAEALAAAMTSLRLDPQREDTRRQCADLLRALGRSSEAEAQYRLALRQAPADLRAWDGLGATLENLAREPEAEACYRTELRIDPRQAQASYNLGVILLNRGRAAEAFPYFQAAARNQPDFAPAYSGLGLAATQLGRNDDAIAYYRRALVLVPDDPRIRFLLGRLLAQDRAKHPAS